MRVMLDTDVILDYLLERDTFVADAKAIWEANGEGRFDGFICASTPANVFSFARKVKGKPTALQTVRGLLAAFDICPVTQAVLQSALTSPITDYEDAVQCESAIAIGMDAIVTRNLEDYKHATLPIYSPADFLALLPM